MTHKPLTKRKALEITRDLWAWLAKNPSKDKNEWPGWAIHALCF